MLETNQSSVSPQFGTAEYSQNQKDTCSVCKQYVSGTYYRASGAMLCGSCADRLRSEMPKDSHAVFVRALLFGLGGFLVALIAYSAVGILLQGWTIGYLALGVGWIVGKAMMLGSKGIGGRRYQIIAILLTYAAVSMSAIPIGISMISRSKAPVQQTAPSKDSSPAPADATSQQKAEEQPAAVEEPQTSLAGSLGKLALRGLASPFMELQDGPGGFIMLIILFVGMQFAWKMTDGRGAPTLDGPYEQTASASK